MLGVRSSRRGAVAGCLLLRGQSYKVKTETPGVKNINRRRRKQSLHSEGFLLLGGFVGSLLR